MNTNVGSAIHVSCLPNYDRIDTGRGRCRISPSSTLLSRLPTLRIGRVLRLRIFDPESTRSIDILCTIWPDSDNVLSGNEIAVDDSIVVGERFRWTNLSCQVFVAVKSKPRSHILSHSCHIDYWSSSLTSCIISKVFGTCGHKVETSSWSSSNTWLQRAGREPDHSYTVSLCYWKHWYRTFIS